VFEVKTALVSVPVKERLTPVLAPVLFTKFEKLGLAVVETVYGEMLE
jgi:hypothetical protein